MVIISDDALDRDLTWLKRVAGVDDEYLARWDRALWAEWSKSMHAQRDAPCPSVPRWMAPKLVDWHQDFSLPYPCVAQLWPTMEAWFQEADDHDDLTLIIQEPGEGYSPTLAKVRQAWEFAADRAVTPALAISVVPHRDIRGAVIGEIEAFYVTDIAQPFDEISGDLAEILGADGAAPPLALPGVERALGWEWMYG